ncbi:unnamed protein product [Diamesa serratosioi]
MKTKIWILLLISVSSIITATSNETTPTSVDFAESLAKENRSEGEVYILPLKMLPTTPSTLLSVSHNNGVNNSYRIKSGHQKTLDDSLKYKRSAVADNSLMDDPSLCEQFNKVNAASRQLYSPNYPGLYPNKSNCVVVIEAPAGHLIQLDFRDHFNVEPSDECKFDYLEIRDGAHGFSNQLGQFCGHSFPDIITSRDRWLWLHFKSDENIEYNGFKIVYEFIPRPTSLVYVEEACRFEVGGHEGWVNNTDVPKEKLDFIVEHNLQLDCMWVIEVQVGWKIQLLFNLFKLKKPNDCDSNFVDIFQGQTDIPSRIQNFCGSIADSVTSKSNVLHIRYFSEAAAINSSFQILYTAYRDKPIIPGSTCGAEEYDCEDNTCIDKHLRCNGRINCRFRWDEEACAKITNEQSEHIKIIVVVFGIILSCMLLVFVVNCMRKIIRDHKVIREHIRQSRESKLDELGRHSTKLTKSREHIAMAQLTKIPPPAFDLESPTSMNVNDNNHHYYREGTTMSSHKNGTRLDSKSDLNIRDQEIKTILGTSYDDDRHINDSEMCDMACQTRESLFQPVFKNKVTQSPCPLPGNLRFSTFGYDSSTPSPPPPPLSHIPIHQNQQQHIQTSSVMVGQGSCPTHSQQTKSTGPHQHHQHHHHYHHLQDQANLNSNDRKTSTSRAEMNDFGMMTDLDDAKHKKYVLKKDEHQAKSYSDIRKSAPDVIIISGCNTSH